MLDHGGGSYSLRESTFRNVLSERERERIFGMLSQRDHSKNTFSDNYYRAAMVEALGETVTPVVSVMQVINRLLF